MDNKDTIKKDLDISSNLEYFKSFYFNNTVQDTCKQFNIGETTLYRWLKKYNITSKVSNKIKITQEVVDYYLEHTEQETLKKFGLTRAPFEKFLRDNNIGKPKKNITKEELNLILINTNYSINDCAEQLGCSSSLIYKLCEKYGICLNNKINIEKEELAAYYNNHTRLETCTHFNVSDAILVKFLKKYNLKKQIMHVEDAAELVSKEQLLEYFVKKDHTIHETAEFFSLSDSAIINLTKYYNISKLNYSKEQIKKLIAESNEKLSMTDLANKLGLCYSQVTHLIDNLGLKNYIDYRPAASSYEKEIEAYLDLLGVNYIKNNRTLLDNGLELDIYIPDKNIGIEFNGNYWHSSLQKQKTYHLNKSKLAAEKNIRLIHIWQYEWNDLKQQDKLKMLLKTVLTESAVKIYARKCVVKQLTNKESKKFLQVNHLQGYHSAKINLGLFHNNELVQVMTFNNTKYNKNLYTDNDWELIRECSKADTVIVGGCSKLFTYFLKNYLPNKVFSYCDFNKFTGDSYKKLGMDFIGYTGPDMHWLLKNDIVVNRTPNKNKELKEVAIAKLFGAGSLKFEYRRES